MDKSENLKKKLDMLNKNSHYGVMDVIDANDIFYYYGMIMNVDPAEIKKIVNNYIESYQKEEIKMKKATSVQNIKNVRDIVFSVAEYPIGGSEDAVTVVVSTNDDIFEFNFEGQDLVQKCKAAGLFTGWEKDQKIRELEEENKKLKKEKEDEKPSTRADILDQAKKCVCGQREQDYGTPESNFKLIADLWNAYLGFTSYVLELEEYLMELKDKGIDVDINVPEPKAIFPEDVAMMMALLKIARIRNGGGSGDSFVDLAGYAACGGEIWTEEKKKKKQDQN